MGRAGVRGKDETRQEGDVGEFPRHVGARQHYEHIRVGGQRTIPRCAMSQRTVRVGSWPGETAQVCGVGGLDQLQRGF